MDRIIIVGGGQAGLQAADSLRAEGYGGAITLFADESHLPYQRPPLSKDFMAECDSLEPLALRAQGFFSELDIDFRPGRRIMEIDRSAGTVTADDGSVLEYSDLILATGARNRRLDIEGADLAGVHCLRTVDEAAALHQELGRSRRIVVVGAGFIGLEFAAAARARGIDVTVLEFAPRPMARVLSEPMSAHFAEVHTASGIDLRFGEGIASLTGENGRITAAVGTSGTVYPADLALVGVGVAPNCDLAEAAGLPASNGIEVDRYLQTPDPHIWAIGDCANYPNTHAGGMTRLESVQNATDQGKALAKTLTGEPTAYTALPWFWSQQGRLKLQIAGIAPPTAETVIRGDRESGRFSVFCFAGGSLAGVESVNKPADHLAARRLLEAGLPLSPAQAADLDFDLKAYSKQEPVAVS